MSAVNAGELVLGHDDGAGTSGRSLRRLWRLKWGLLAAAFMLAIVGCALAAPLIAPHDPVSVDIRHRLAPPAWMAGAPAAAVAAPDAETRAVAPEALVAVRRADRHTGVTLMIVGLAGVLTGLIVDEGAITVAGAVVGGEGLFMYRH